MCLKFKGYKNCLEATQLESKKDHKEFIKNNELILKCDKLWFQNRLTLIMLKRNHEITQFKVPTNSWSFIQVINKWRFWIWKKDSLFNVISRQTDIDKTYLHAKDPYETKYQLLINKQKSTGLKH